MDCNLLAMSGGLNPVVNLHSQRKENLSGMREPHVIDPIINLMNGFQLALPTELLSSKEFLLKQQK